MNDIAEAFIGPDATIQEAVAIIDRSPGKIALVVTSERVLIGTITDGDVRRGLLRGVPLEGSVQPIINTHPRVAHSDTEKEVLLARMRQERLRHLPLVDGEGQLVGLETLVDLLESQRLENWVVLMAGGEGRRLRPLTDDVPKPMLSVGSKPLLETIINSFISAGFHKFFLSVNYKAELVERHFGDGSSRGIEIQYLREAKPLGTAGSLSLLRERPAMPFIVMNGDILTKVDFREILNFHRDHRAAGTMCVREYCIQVPYGVVQVRGNNLLAIEEKPTARNFVNAGVYVLEPEVLDKLPPGTAMTMPDLFGRLIAERRPCCVCPIREYWLDVGQMADLQRANNEFSAIFDE
jgi:dTDP-glucose pyrophosphorylase